MGSETNGVRKRRWPLWAIFVLLVSLGGAPLRPQQPIKMQFFEVAPHIYIDPETGKVTGAVYDLLENYMAPEMGVKLQWQAVPIPRQMENYEVKKEKRIGSAWFAHTPERARMKHMVFTSHVLFPDTPCLMVRKTSKLNAVRSVEDILDLTIGYSSVAYRSKFMQDPRIRWDMVHGSNYYPSNFRKFKAGRVDAIYAGSGAILLYFIRQFGLDDEVKLLFLPERKTLHYAAFSADMPDVLEKYDKAYHKLDVPRLYLKLLGRYIDTSKLAK